MAFQIADDLIDYTEDEGDDGQAGGLDLREHKVTLPLIAALRVMVSDERPKGRCALFDNDGSGRCRDRDVIEIVTDERRPRVRARSEASSSPRGDAKRWRTFPIP